MDGTTNEAENGEAIVASAGEAAVSAEAEAVSEPVASATPAAPAADASSSSEEIATISRQVASKWVKTSVLRRDPRVARHIPETRIFSPANVAAMLSRYGRVVLKPVIGTGGSGVIMIVRSGSSYTVRHQRRILRYGSFGAMMAAVRKMRRKRRYLVQRGILLATIGGRPIDYRVKVVKHNKTWVTRAMVGRLARHGLFVTNLCRGGTQLSSAVGIRRSLSARAVSRKKAEMRQITRICIELLERQFPGIGQLGFDYGFDRSGKLWIFEVNTRPH